MGFHPRVVGAFEIVFAPVRRTMVHGPVWLATGTSIEAGVPVLLVANHTSWWDGFILRDVQKRLRPGAAFHTLMTAAELRRHPYLRWMGCLGVERGNGASVLAAFRSLRNTRMQQESAVFGFFPQGRIWPTSRRPLGFERGVAVLASLLAPVTIVPVAIHLEPLNRAASTAFVSLGTPLAWREGQPDHRDLEARVEEELNRIRQVLEEYGEDAAGIVRLQNAAE